LAVVVPGAAQRRVARGSWDAARILRNRIVIAGSVCPQPTPVVLLGLLTAFVPVSVFDMNSVWATYIDLCGLTQVTRHV